MLEPPGFRFVTTFADEAGLPTDKQKKRKEWKDWPKDTYYTNLKDDWTNPFPFPELPITPSDEQYFLKMTTAEHNGTGKLNSGRYIADI